MDCNSSACAVEIGRILNVEKMALSKVGRLGDTYYLTLSLVNVETGEIEASSEEECPCNVEELPLAMDVIVKKLIVSLAK
jgi:PBP1b-binding outer membrane lipoprotein LpoB